MSSQYLIPETRVNKNGVPVVKWVRSEQPAPRTREISRGPGTAPITVPALDNLSTPLGFSALSRERLDELNSGALTAINSMAGRAAQEGLSWFSDSVVQDAFNTFASYGYTGEKAVNNLAVFGDAVITKDAKRYGVFKLIKGLSYSPPKDYLMDATDEERDQAVALVTLASMLDNDFVSGSDEIRIKSDELATFALSRLDDVHEIARLVNERHSDDVELLRRVIDHEATAIQEGVL